MPRGSYAPLSVSQEHSAVTEDEMEEAFESDDEDNKVVLRSSTQGITIPSPTTPTATQAQDGAYDFEREYDRPPPGSPPAALGNSNGVIPSPSSIFRPESSEPRPSFFRRAVGALLPQHYTRVPAHEAEVVGSGIENDGVFSNVSARPAPPRAVRDEHGDIQVMPEDAQTDVPPSYAAAQADSAPPYWETTVHAPAFGGVDDMLIEGLPAGTIFSFAWNFLISVSFQFVGFMLTYLMHTSHAAKYGSRAGFGITLIQYGLYARAANDDPDIFGDGADGDEVGITPFASTPSDDQMSPTPLVSRVAMHDWLSFLIMACGWILLLSSVLGFARVKRWERSILTPTPAPVISPEARQRDEEVRSLIAQTFGLDVLTSEEAHEASSTNNDSNQNALSEEDVQVARHLRAAGLI